MASISYDTVVEVEIATDIQDAQTTGFGVLNTITKESGSISRSERYRLYSGIDGVAEDHETDSEVYVAAQTYFSQVPKPDTLMISVRYEDAQVAELRCGSVTDYSLFEDINDGSFLISVNGVEQTVSGINFGSETISSMEDVAIVIDNNIPDATCTYEGNKHIHQCYDNY